MIRLTSERQAPARAHRPEHVRVISPLMKMLPVPVPGLHDWNERIAAR